MSYLKPNLAGVYDIPSINVSSELYIRGKPFQQFINELSTEDQLEQSEIDEIKLLLQYLDTTGLNQAWLVDNSNRNAELKTSITTLQTRADGHDTSIGSLNTKTQFITESQLGTTANNNYSAFYLDVGNGQIATGINEIRLGVGQYDFIKLLRNFDDETMSQILLFTGKINLWAQEINLKGNVNIGTLKTGLITPRDNGTYKIGGANSRVEVGATEDPEITGATTEIYIGKRTTLRNTKTYLQGNIATDEARLTDVTVTDVVTWQNVASWLAGFTLTGVPYFIATFALGGTPSYRYSDVVKMANNYLTGGLTKNGKIETSNDLALKALTIVNTDLISLSTPFDGLLNRLVLQAFAIHGSHSIGTIWGKVNMYAGKGEVELRNDGGIFDWAFKNAGNANQLVLKDDNVELIQCNGGSGDTGRKLTLGACCGNIEMITGTNGVRSAATKVMEIKGNKQVQIGNNSTMVDDTYKVLVDATSHANGIKVAKNGDALLLNPTNVSSKSVTLQDNYTGSTTNALYKNASNQLMWNGEKVGASPVGTSGGLTYSVPVATNITNPAPTPTTITMTTEYTSIAQRTITQAITTNAVFYVARLDTPIIDKAANPFISGIQQFNIYTTWNSSNQAGQLTGKLHYRANSANTMFSKTYAAGVVSTAAAILGGTPIAIPLGDYEIVAPRSIWTGINIVPTASQTCVINGLLQVRIAGVWTTIVTTSGLVSTTVSLSNQTITINNTANLASGANVTHTAIRLALQATNGTITQTASGAAADAGAYTIQGSSINASFRTMLYNGTAYPITTPYSVTPVLLEYDFAADPYEIADFNNSTLSADMFFQQPTGGFNNHSIIFYFNTGAISHFHSTINAPPSVAVVGTSTAGVDYDSTITQTTADATPPPSFYGQMNLVPNFFEARLYTDIFISANGKYAWAVGNNLDNTLNAIVSGDNHGYNWNPHNTIDNFRTISGTAIGDVVWAIASGTQQNGTPYNVVYESKFAFNNINFDWTVQPVITLDNFNTAALPQQIRVSSDGKYQIITDYRSNTNAKVYLSADYGKIWTTKNVTPNFVTRCIGCAISGTGKYMYVCVDGISTGQGGLYQSKDFGETWARVLTAPADPHKRVSCDATGRYVAIGRGSNMQASRDYGFTWRVINESNNLSVCVSPDGQFCWFGQSNGDLYFMNSYLTQLQIGNDFSPLPRPSGNTYVNQAHDCIAVSNKGTVVIAAGLAGKLNLYRELPSEVRLLSTSTSILVKASADLAGAYSLEYKPPTSGNNNIQRTVVENQLAPVAGSANTPPEDRIVAATSIVPRKPFWYNTTENWKTVSTISQTGQHRDCYMSDTGRYILTAMGTDGNAISQFQLNLNRGYTDEIGWQLVGPANKYWRTVCGSSIGNRMFAVSAKTPLGDFNNSLWTSSDYGVTWTELTNTPAAFKSNTTIGQVRCCGIGRNVFISSLTGGNIYRSEDFGATWTTITVNFGIGTIPSIHVNSVGQYVFATIPSYGIWRSYDFGLTFQQVNTSTTAWLNITCNATAQFVVATRSGATYAYSDDYGTSWTFGAATYVDVTIAPAGNLVWFCADGILANSDNNGVTIRSTLSTTYNPQSLAMNATGEYVFAPLSPSVGNGTLAIKALNLREAFTNTRNIVAGTGVEIVNQGEGSYQISATPAANVPSTQSLYWNSTSTTSKVIFTLPSAIDLRLNNARVTMTVRCNRTIIYPCFSYNDQHQYPTLNNYAGQLNQLFRRHNGGGIFVYPNHTPLDEAYSDGSVNFCSSGVGNPSAGTFNDNYYFTLDFVVTMNHSIPAGVNVGHMVTNGKYSIVDKSFNSQSAVYFSSGDFSRVTEVTTSPTTSLLQKISFFGYDTQTAPIKSAHITVERIPASPLTAVT